LCANHEIVFRAVGIEPPHSFSRLVIDTNFLARRRDKRCVLIQRYRLQRLQQASGGVFFICCGLRVMHLGNAFGKCICPADLKKFLTVDARWNIMELTKKLLKDIGYPVDDITLNCCGGKPV
jgi:hypothetical protein